MKFLQVIVLNETFIFGMIVATDATNHLLLGECHETQIVR